MRPASFGAGSVSDGGRLDPSLTLPAPKDARRFHHFCTRVMCPVPLTVGVAHFTSPTATAGRLYVAAERHVIAFAGI